MRRSKRALSDLPTAELSVSTYYDLLTFEIQSEALQKEMHPIYNNLASQNKKIGDLTNFEFDAFKKWVIKFKKLATENNLAVRDRLEKDSNPFNKPELLNIDISFIQALLKLVKKKSLHTLFGQPDKLTQALSNFYKKNFPFRDIIKIQTQLVSLVEKQKDFAFSLPFSDIRFKIMFYLACYAAKVKADSPRELFLSASTASIGAVQVAVESVDPDKLIFIESSWEDAQVLIVDEIISQLESSSILQNPLAPGERLDENALKELLSHPAIRDAVLALHEKELPRLCASNLERIEGVVPKLKELADLLYNASTDSGRDSFDEIGANEAIEAFQMYSHELPQDIQDALNDPELAFYIKSRFAKTNYSRLFASLQHDACSGQLAISVREWANAFELEKENVVNAISHQQTSMSPYISLMKEVTINPIYELPLTPKLRANSHWLANNYKKLGKQEETIHESFVIS